MDFETRTCGKWILAGEHSVLRGSAALAFPLYARSLSLKFEKSNKDITCDLAGARGEEYRLLFWGLVERALELLKISRGELKGHLFIDSNLPVGGGLGASAALCSAVAQWLSYLGYVDSLQIYEFSRQLENVFHGESSGVDVAVSLKQKPLLFERSGRQDVFDIKWNPHWYISYCGQRGVTSECVNQVKKLIQQNPELGQRLDLQMANAVEGCMEALLVDGSLDQAEDKKSFKTCSYQKSTDPFNKLVENIELAHDCFREWGLVYGRLSEHIDFLRQQGAVAVKPTGSGGGGFVLSLWPDQAPQDLKEILISCN